MTAINLLQSNSTDRFYYRRHLPHYQPSDATFFVTFRLAGSLPAAIIEKIRIDRQLKKRRIEDIGNRKNRSDEWHEFNDECFSRFDGLLDKNEKGPLWLQNPRVASIVQDAIHHRDKKEYNLIAYCIMPNHVHMVFEIITVDEVAESAVNGVGRLAESTIKATTRLNEITKSVKGRDSVSTYIVTQIMGSLKNIPRFGQIAYSTAPALSGSTRATTTLCETMTIYLVSSNMS